MTADHWRQQDGAAQGAATMIPGIAADGALYPIEKMEAHRRGAFHQAVSVFVFAGDRLLIQRRALEKYHSGGQWANTCCTHPHWGESAEDCARRRLVEELGLELAVQPAKLIEYSADVGGGLWEHERVQVFCGNAEDTALALAPNPDEVCATRWIALERLRQEMAQEPQRFTPWLHIYMQRWSDLGLPW